MALTDTGISKMKLTVKSDLKKYQKLNGHSANAYSVGNFIKYLSMRFEISEYELRKAHKRGKIRVYID